MNGKYGYTIQGFLHAQGFDSYNYLAETPIELNLADTVLKMDKDNPDPGGTRPTNRGLHKMQMFAAFYPHDKQKTTFYPPDPPDQQTDRATIVGYYPMTEIGYMILGEQEQNAFHEKGLYGPVRGWRRINVAGYPGTGSTFTGRYKFDALHEGPGIHYQLGLIDVTGIVTTQDDIKLQNVRDYAFVQISADEILITANGFMPRPGVAAGNMKRIP